MSLLITICGRGGSKGIPGKNIKQINGIPLIGYSINCAKAFAELKEADIALSTDSLEIKRTAARMGIETSYNRPPELANDEAGKISVIAALLAHEEKTRSKK